MAGAPVALLLLALLAALSRAGAARTGSSEARQQRLRVRRAWAKTTGARSVDSCPPEGPKPWETCALLVVFDETTPDDHLDAFASEHPDSYVLRSAHIVSLPYGSRREDCCKAQVELQNTAGVRFVDFDNHFAACDMVDGAINRESDDMFCKCSHQTEAVFCSDTQVAGRKFDLAKVLELCSESSRLHCAQPEVKCAEVFGATIRAATPPPLCKCGKFDEKVFCGRVAVAERKFNLSDVKAIPTCEKPRCAAGSQS